VAIVGKCLVAQKIQKGIQIVWQYILLWLVIVSKIIMQQNEI